MPNTKDLASQANAEVGAAAYERKKYTMQNGEDGAQGEATEAEAYEHKPIKRSK
jgi:hypothetical protein